MNYDRRKKYKICKICKKRIIGRKLNAIYCKKHSEIVKKRSSHKANIRFRNKGKRKK